MYSKIAYVLGEKLTATEFKAAYQLAYFVGYETCILTNNKSGRGNEYLTLQDIADILGMDYKTASRVVRSLRNKGVMALVEVGHCDNKYYTKYYVMNPYIYINGKVPDKDTLIFFFFFFFFFYFFFFFFFFFFLNILVGKRLWKKRLNYLYKIKMEWKP